jgi:hypothetical protein
MAGYAWWKGDVTADGFLLFPLAQNIFRRPLLIIPQLEM